MSDRRIKFHEKLVGLFDESVPVYFQPGPSITMKYPCLVYSISRFDITHANNKPYNIRRRYTLTLIDARPDSPLAERLMTISGISSERVFVNDGLYHYVFNVTN